LIAIHLFRIQPWLYHWRRLWLWLALLIYWLLTCYQLGLPGLHYDEAREAGLNAMELLTGAPIHAFRNVTIPFWGLRLPIMVQDYIGALNVYLALPVLWVSGIGVPNLRMVAVLTGLVALILLERTVTTWSALLRRDTPVTQCLAISLPGLTAITLLAASPSFVFWSRQGIFVTNLTLPLVFGCLWQGLDWVRTGRRRALIISAFAAGAALYAKLIAVWIVGPFVLLLGGWWLWRYWRPQPQHSTPVLSWSLLLAVVLAFCIPLIPLVFFNGQSGGIGRAVISNLDTSYYGVDNWALGANLAVRSRQVVQTLQGRHFWYLGGLYSNSFAPWLTLIVIPLGFWRGRAFLVGPLLLLAAAFVSSLFTISDLFITHYALLHPLFVAVIALAITASYPVPYQRLLLFIVLSLWVMGDLNATLRYHGALARSGGLADHSDVGYHLAYYLRYHGLGAPVALDWGFDAPVRYLSEGAVTPIELFGYGSPTAPDPDFTQRLALFLGNPNNVYLLHTPAATVFQGRREQFFDQIQQAGYQPHLENTFTQRDGTPLIELWRVLPP
jgi:hypothetical protein